MEKAAARVGTPKRVTWVRGRGVFCCGISECPESEELVREATVGEEEERMVSRRPAMGDGEHAWALWQSWLGRDGDWMLSGLLHQHVEESDRGQ
jgi:hypothetical protein